MEKIDNILMGSMALILGIISILGFMGALENTKFAGQIPNFTLLLVSFIAGYLIFERRNKLDKIEQNIQEGTSQAIRSLNGVETRIFTDRQEVYEYVTERILDAQKSVDDLTWGRLAETERTLSQVQAYKNYLEAITKSCCKKNIYYREVMTFPNKERLQRAETMIAKNPYNYQLGYYNVPHNQMMPLMDFMVIDSNEVILAFFGESELHISIKHPDIVSLFHKYYSAIWQNSDKIKEADNIYHDKIQNIRQNLEKSSYFN